MSYNYLKAARKIICIGRNYAAHIKELNNSTPKQPFFFLKPTSSIVTPLSSSLVKTTRPANSTFNGLNEDGTNPGPIFIPRGVKVHHEIELALIVSKHLSNVTKMKPEEVYDSISGVALALDLTARNVQDEAKKKGLPWTISKGFDTFMPISAIVSREKFSSKISKSTKGNRYFIHNPIIIFSSILYAHSLSFTFPKSCISASIKF